MRDDNSNSRKLGRSRNSGAERGAWPGVEILAHKGHPQGAPHGQDPEHDPMSDADAAAQEGTRDFIRDIVRADLAAGPAM